MRTKTKLAITLGTIVTGVVSYLAYELTEESIKEQVLKIWDEVKDGITSDLGLNQVPTLAWDGEPNCVMHVTRTYHYNQKNLFADKVITKTETDYVIHINIAILSQSIRFLKQGAFYLNTDLIKLAITQFFHHECRHLWQAQGNFYVGEAIPIFKMNFNEGHGESRDELDANLYALSKAKTQREKVLAEFMKKDQECSGKIFDKDNKKEKAAFIKEFNPMYKVFKFFR